MAKSTPIRAAAVKPTATAKSVGKVPVKKGFSGNKFSKGNKG